MYRRPESRANEPARRALALARRGRDGDLRQAQRILGRIGWDLEPPHEAVQLGDQQQGKHPGRPQVVEDGDARGVEAALRDPADHAPVLARFNLA